MKWDVLVVGSGPIGSFTAEKIAAAGFSVLLAEEHCRVGDPVQCAGLISPRALSITGLEPDLVLNKFRGLRVFSPLGTRLQTESGRVFSLAVDRGELDRRLAEKAENAGTLLLTNTTITGLEPIPGGYRAAAIRRGKSFDICARLVIGADGCHSRVAQWLNLDTDTPKAVMYAADVKLSRADTSFIDVFLGQELAPGWFGWLIPINQCTCRVGTGYAFNKPPHSVQHYFQQLTAAYPEIFQGIQVLRHTGGTVPFGPLPRIYSHHAMLVGDAACQTKPISGGGIFTGLMAAGLCAETAVSALISDDLSEKSLAAYQQRWNKEMGNELASAMNYRRSFLEFSDRDIEMLTNFLNKPKWLKTILEYGDIDYPSFLASKLYLLHPLVRTVFRKVCHIPSAPGPFSSGMLGHNHNSTL